MEALLSSSPTPAPLGRRVVRRALALALGLAVGLAGAEGLLRVWGAWSSPVARVSPASGELTILVEGDSFAYGLASEDERGFPEHLGSLLQHREPARPVSVHNRGMPGFNSGQALARLREDLPAIRPHVVVLLVGHNNGWNFNALDFDGLGVSAQATRALGGLRLVRLASFLLRYSTAGVPDQRAAAWLADQKKAAKKRKFSRELATLETLLADHPDDVWALLKKAALLEASGDALAARSARARAEALDPDGVARIETVSKGVDAWHDAQRARGEGQYLDPEPASVSAAYRAMAAKSTAEPGSEEGVLAESLVRDLIRMVEAVRAAGAVAIVSGYPNDKPANESLRTAAGAVGVPYVDQHAAFSDAVRAGTPMGELFVLDGHCTSAGYRRMAQVLLPSVEDALDASR